MQGTFSTRIQLLLPRFPLHLGKTNTTSVFTFDFFIFLLLLDCLSSVQHIERNQHGHILLSSSTWSLEHVDCVSHKFRDVFFEKLWDHMRVLFVAEWIQRREKTTCRALSFLFPPGTIPFPNWIEISEIQLWNMHTFSIVRNKCVFHQFWSYWNSTRVSHISWITYGFLVFQAAVSFGFAAVLFY